MLLKNRFVFPLTKNQELLLQQDDAWLNDAVSVPQSPKTVERVTEKPVALPVVQVQGHAQITQVPIGMPASDEQEAITTPLGTSIVPGHRLWAVVLHLSESIRQELLRKSGSSTAAEAVQMEYVRVRTLDMLRSEPKIAQEVRDLSEGKLLLQGVLDEVCGYGPLTPLMQDDSITEITVVGPRFAYVERNGMVEDVPCTFEDDRHMQRIIENMLRKAGRHMRNDWPIVDVRLPDGSLVNIVMPPSAVNGPTITIRKGSTKPLSIENLLQLGTLSQEMAEFLRTSVQARKNIVICGGVNSGRTTMLNALSAAIPAEERIVTIEDVAELRLSQRHVVGMVAQMASPDNPGGVTMRDLVRHALRMGTDRILLGECQGDEVVEMLKAMYNGHDGSLLTLFANDLRSCLSRLEAIYLASGSAMPVTMIRNQIATAIDVIVYMARLRDGTRKILNIAEVQGVVNDAVKWQNIFYYKGIGS